MRIPFAQQVWPCLRATIQTSRRTFLPVHWGLSILLSRVAFCKDISFFSLFLLLYIFAPFILSLESSGLSQDLNLDFVSDISGMNTCKSDVNSQLKHLSSDQKLKTWGISLSFLQNKKLQKTDQICHLSFSFNEKIFTPIRYIYKKKTSVSFLNSFIRQKYPSFVISVISSPLMDKPIRLLPTQLTCKKKKN